MEETAAATAAASSFTSLLRNLKVDDPWTPPQTWESIPSESGGDSVRSLPSDSKHNSEDSILDLSAISEENLVRLVINALQGVKSTLVVIEKLSVTFCSSPADRTSHRVPNLWCRSSSTSALGKMLKSIAHSGFVFLFLREFVNYYLFPSLDTIGESGDKGSGAENQKDHMPVGSCSTPLNVHHKEKVKMHPPFSLVNQAFAVAVGKVVEGYLSALNTLLASVRLRRSVKHAEAAASMTDDESILTSIVHSEITFLEVYLHTQELRTYIDVLGNICFPTIVDYTSFEDNLTSQTTFQFQNFPRGADLLTHLYVLLRDADPGHHALLKFLFVQSCEPYYGFIKSWIYHASVDDPYEEFFVASSDVSPTSKHSTGLAGDSSLASLKQFKTQCRDCSSVPCFLKDICRPLLRAGQQIEVLVKLLNLCSSVVLEEHLPCSLATVKDILPCWFDAPYNSAPQLNPLTFSKKGIEVLICNRETMYKSMLERLQFFFTKLDGKYQRMDQTVISPGDRSANFPLPFVSDWDLNFSSTFDKEGAIHVDAGRKDADASSTSDVSSFEVEPQSSDTDSSYEEEIEPEGFSELHNTSYQHSQDHLSNLLQRSYPSKCVLLKSETEIPNYVHSFHDDCEMGRVIRQGHQYQDNEKLSQKSAFKSNATGCTKVLEAFDEVYQSGKCWPLGGILENPFYADLKSKVPKQLHSMEYRLEKDGVNMEYLERDESKYGETLVPCSSVFDVVRKAQVVSDQNGNLPACTIRSWNCFEHYDLNINPMLTKSDWLCTVRDLRKKSSIRNGGSCVQYFDFSSVTDLSMAHLDYVLACDDKGSQVDVSTFVASGVPVVGLNEDHGGCVKVATNQSGLNSVYSSRETSLPSKVLSSASGGAGWEALLNYSGDNISFSSENTSCDSMETFEIPLDIIIDKCMVQEILTQYKYVSNFTIKLLEDGFDLHEHLLALRHYHFMELADWADSFIISVRKQKWSLVETDQNLTKIQGLLDLALQRSACERDPYRKRLFFYMRGQNITQQPNFAIGLHAFHSVMLGYRVDWPVNIVITQDALKIYGEIFSYLIQVRLAVFSLTDVWHCLKALTHSIKHGSQMGSDEMKGITTLTKIRQQINHFVATLQQYVHSQLSDVSWCQFQHSLKHQVKDILDLESVHMSYLADALHICFLSADAKPTANIIKNILQCALDFRLCFPANLEFVSDGKVPLDLRSQINFSQVFAIKSTFEKSLKELYILYLRSPKHGEFSLCRFWGHLNYNDYYAINITKEMGYLYH
ncbi:Uncharacterized protein M6B38_219255 [Iris pallida]|uniref:Gamma-tubulin complex component n=1 Tax=Iris pallida TaxID=29817 RepID=A0AAX6DXX4_IRIPA|nr:Uncharacterized protein M6B38_219255 [Iris pallida]